MFVMLSNHVDGCVASFNFSAFLIFSCQYSCCFLLLTFLSIPLSVHTSGMFLSLPWDDYQATHKEAERSVSDYHTCKPAHSSPPHLCSLHKSKKESDREGRRDSERKKCETGWVGEQSPLDICSIRCCAQQWQGHRERQQKIHIPRSCVVSCTTEGLPAR